VPSYPFGIIVGKFRKPYAVFQETVSLSDAFIQKYIAYLAEARPQNTQYFAGGLFILRKNFIKPANSPLLFYGTCCIPGPILLLHLSKNRYTI
jgi:hypothetical protein